MPSQKIVWIVFKLFYLTTDWMKKERDRERTERKRLLLTGKRDRKIEENRHKSKIWKNEDDVNKLTTNF